jgi:hypothetical protein
MIRNAVIAERPLNVIAGYPAGGSARRAKGRRAT